MPFPHSAAHGGCWQGFQLLGRQAKELLCALSLHEPWGAFGVSQSWGPPQLGPQQPRGTDQVFLCWTLSYLQFRD